MKNNVGYILIVLMLVSFFYGIGNFIEYYSFYSNEEFYVLKQTRFFDKSLSLKFSISFAITFLIAFFLWKNNFFKRSS